MSEPSQQPSQQARRAAEAVTKYIEGNITERIIEYDKVAEIIERETGAGEAVKLIAAFTRLVSRQEHIPEGLLASATEFLTKHQP